MVETLAYPICIAFIRSGRAAEGDETTGIPKRALPVGEVRERLKLRAVAISRVRCALSARPRASSLPISLRRFARQIPPGVYFPYTPRGTDG